MEQQFFDYNLTQNDLKCMSVLGLAFLGDSVHTLYVRQNVVLENFRKLGDYNKICSHFCRAKTQSEVLDKLMPMLNDDELDLVRRTRNAKTNNIAKNSNLVEYKKATCFETLIGYLYLNKNFDRLKKFLEISIKREEK